MGMFRFGKTSSPEIPAPAAPTVPALQAGPRGNFIPMDDLLRLVVD